MAYDQEKFIEEALKERLRHFPEYGNGNNSYIVKIENGNVIVNEKGSDEKDE